MDNVEPRRKRQPKAEKVNQKNNVDYLSDSDSDDIELNNNNARGPQPLDMDLPNERAPLLERRRGQEIKNVDSFAVGGYCLGIFAKSACRVATATGAAVGIGYAIGGAAATSLVAYGAVGCIAATVSRCGDDVLNASRTADAKANVGQGPGRSAAEAFCCLPEPKKMYR